jgi:hypothetical protein
MTIPKAFLDHKKRHYLGWAEFIVTKLMKMVLNPKDLT